MSEAITILVADDDPRMLVLTTEVLGEAGYEVLQASNGKECLEALKAHHPDIVLLDVMLPDTTGIELCRQIKADERLQGIFVILFSGVQVSSDYQADALNAGADGYIVKSVSNKELLARVQSAVRIKRMVDALREKEKEQQKLILELQAALAESKLQDGFVPMSELSTIIKKVT
ncbi:MAG TPA: response regulator transcription factor [Syntrophorhabdales bacterium]|nr:response regulator transcription factor [Syntrophorhabdales bacterium]